MQNFLQEHFSIKSEAFQLFDQHFGYDLRLIECHVDTAAVKRLYFALTIIAKNVGLHQFVLLVVELSNRQTRLSRTRSVLVLLHNLREKVMAGGRRVRSI